MAEASASTALLVETATRSSNVERLARGVRMWAKAFLIFAKFVDIRGVLRSPWIRGVPRVSGFLENPEILDNIENSLDIRKILRILRFLGIF